MHKQRLYVILNLEVSDRTRVTPEDVTAALRDLVDIPQVTKDKETYWVETGTAFDNLPELQTALEKELV